MNKVSIFQFKGVNIELTFSKGSLAYGFEIEGKNYGISMKLPSKKVMDVASITFLLITNATETIDKLNENQTF